MTSPGVAVPGSESGHALQYVGEQKIPAFKLGNRWRFKKSRLDQWMEEVDPDGSESKRKPKRLVRLPAP